MIVYFGWTDDRGRHVCYQHHRAGTPYPLLCPDGGPFEATAYDWGAATLGAATLAYALLAHACGRDAAWYLYVQYTASVVRTWTLQSWSVRRETVRAAARALWAGTYPGRRLPAELDEEGDES